MKQTYTEHYDWMVSYHPEEKDFTGRRFRSSDVQYGSWPEGMIFTNINTGEVLVWKNNRAVAIRTSVESTKAING
jgi:hypothetical protein